MLCYLAFFIIIYICCLFFFFFFAGLGFMSYLSGGVSFGVQVLGGRQLRSWAIIILYSHTSEHLTLADLEA